ncbi:MAG: pyridoxamine 5'-phosphate oxidase family protein [Microthrixaceae bacterium]|nr:pyridoxamine 5'-phosphate oxidase family protein [Microthrixaceae bacterium]
MLSEHANQIFRSTAMAHLAVVDAKGVPHVTPVWADVNEAGELWFNTAVGRVKDRYLQVGDPVAVSATSLDNPYEYAQVRGKVRERRLESGDADIDALARKYMGVDSYPLRQEGEQRVTIIIEPTSTTER